MTAPARFSSLSQKTPRYAAWSHPSTDGSHIGNEEAATESEKGQAVRLDVTNHRKHKYRPNFGATL